MVVNLINISVITNHSALKCSMCLVLDNSPMLYALHVFISSAVPPAPTKVKLRRISPTAIEVSWDAPTFPGITGYRVYYNMFALPNMDDWQSVEIGPYTVTDINGLEPHTVYAVRVRARGADGRYGNYSDIVATNSLAQGEYECHKCVVDLFSHCVFINWFKVDLSHLAVWAVCDSK